MLKVPSAWKVFWILGGLGGFVLVNAYVSYLSTKIVPFEARVPLAQQGHSERFRIDSFHKANYVLMLALNHPERSSNTLLRENGEASVREDFDVELRIVLQTAKAE